ncbi:MAG: Jag N-terminal domain-containing protein [Syntrophobacterales bacterium]|jgi:spoIIIJ-associated protein|nr:Jag N-terminal domain-containing protein [Syntrophobacterales bacterium]
MDFVEVEGKTYEEAIRKASLELNAEEKDLDVDVREVDTKGILGLLGSKKVRITARLRAKEVTPEEYGQTFLKELGALVGLTFYTKVSQYENRVIFLIQANDGDVLIGKDGDTLEALQHVLRLAIAKRYKQGLKVLVDINGYREKRKKALTTMAKKTADKAKRTGKRLKTDPLNPYERRIVHSILKHNKSITTKSEGEGHTKKVVISPVGASNGKH